MSRDEGTLDTTRSVTDAGEAVTEDAKRHEGWGTALRPVFEPILIALAPLAGTTVDTVLEHGTGAINIDAARFRGGKWPTNAVLDPGQAETLDALTGTWHDAEPVSARFPIFRFDSKPGAQDRPRAFGVSHATVKPVRLMRWLITLLTPVGGVVLEPFSGSGTTIEAAVSAGFKVLAIEREEMFLPLIESRLDQLLLLPARRQ